MAAAERNAIADMIAEAKANVGVSTTTATGSSSGASEPDGVSITRQTSDHIQGQAKSGMAKLKGKKVKIEGTTFKVAEHLLNRDDDIETVILTRKLSSKKYSGKSQSKPRAKTIFDLNYFEPSDIVYSDDEMASANIQLGKKVNGEGDKDFKFKIALIEPDGTLTAVKMEMIGPDWTKPNLINVVVYDKDNNISENNFNRDFLIRSYLLYQEWVGNFVPDDKGTKADDDHVIFEDDDVKISEVGLGDLPDELQDFLHGFKESRSDSEPEANSDVADALQVMLSDLQELKAELKKDFGGDLKRSNSRSGSKQDFENFLKSKLDELIRGK